ncbi:MAG: type II secretion system F family protein [Actinomycetota bacterium]|nr:type II secretion system F family protein [Actinomycetota bacterium]
MTALLLGSLGLVVGGPALAVAILVGSMLGSFRRRKRVTPPIRPVLLVLLVELRGGRSTLAALQHASSVFPGHRELTLAARLATVKGLTAAVEECQGDIRGLVAQLARAQRSGSPVADTVRSLLDADIAAERTRRLERARSLPVRLIMPITLLVLPGLVLLLYAPSLLRLFADLSEPLT